jgi:small-conductance mechanosensitive channel
LSALTIIIYQYPSVRAFAVGLFAGAGILAVIIGFASQQAFSNMVSGIFIVIFRPFRVGDWIKIGTDKSGIVADITLRHTVIRDFENKRIIIPNSVISSEIIINSSIDDQKIRRHIEFGISYDSDVDKAIAIIQEEAMKHPYFLDNRTKEERKNNEPAVLARLIGFGDSSINLRTYVWSKDPAKSFDLHTDLNRIVKKRFDEEGIEIPFPYRTIVYKKDIE